MSERKKIADDLRDLANRIENTDDPRRLKRIVADIQDAALDLEFEAKITTPEIETHA